MRGVVEASLKTVVALPPEAVFAFVSDPRNEPRWRDVSAVGPADRTPALGAGYTRLTGKGKEVEFDVTEWEPPRRVAFRDRTSDGDHARFELAPDGDRTRLTYTRRERAASAPRPFRRLSTGATRRLMEIELRALVGALGVEPGAIERADTSAAPGPPFTETMDVPASPEAVFAFVSDPLNLPAWRFEGENLVVERTTDGFRTMTEKGESWAMWEIAELDPPHAVRFRDTGSPIRQDLRFVFEPTSAGTRVTYTLDWATDPRRWGRVLRMLTFAWFYAMDGELRRIARGVGRASAPASADRP
jgi:uncharacterized protein YndB with AHSA1/START domain